MRAHQHSRTSRLDILSSDWLVSIMARPTEPRKAPLRRRCAPKPDPEGGGAHPPVLAGPGYPAAGSMLLVDSDVDRGEEREGKRPRTEPQQGDLLEHTLSRFLFQPKPFPTPLPRLPDGADDRHEQLASYFRSVGLKISLVSSPVPAVTVMMDEKAELPSAEAEGLWAMLGLHPQQQELERRFLQGGFRGRARALAFSKRMQTGLSSSVLEVFGAELRRLEQEAVSGGLQGREEARVAAVIQAICDVSKEQRPEALEKEAARLRWRYSSLASTLLQHFLEATGLTLGEAVYRPSAAPGLVRVTLVPWVNTVGGKHPGPFIFMPALATVLKQGPEAVVSAMVASFWLHIWRCGYYPGEEAFKRPVSEQLSDYFRSGIVRNGRTPLRAGFEPQRFLSLYLHGLAGAGKSSFVSKLVPALSATLEEHLDPELDVRFVKQNLNKTFSELNRELTLRPNNNDLSVMSIIQGRRMTLSSSKPGLVVVGLEEVPPADPDRQLEDGPVQEPDLIEQVASLRLLANRFSGMTGETLTAEQRSRLLRQNRGGISDHSTLITVFTSNYPLDPRSRSMLSALPMFSNLLELRVTAIEHEDRRAFSRGFLHHLTSEALAKVGLSLASLTLDVSLDQGDIRDLVRRLHVIAFFASQAARSMMHHSGSASVDLLVKHGDGDGHVEVYLCRANAPEAEAAQQEPWVRLTGLTDRVFLPVERPFVDDRSRQVVQALSSTASSPSSSSALGHILDYFFHGVLTPAVVLTQSRALLSSLADGLAALPGMNSLRGVNAGRDRIVKSLYEGSEVRCLRDDIKAFRRYDPEAMVVIEVDATCREGQLRIREMLEDSPSMIAFSTARSALQKRGLFFAVLVGDDITPELTSRASIVLLDS